MLEVKQWCAHHLYTGFTTSAWHLPTAIAVMETKHHKCYKVHRSKILRFCSSFFFKCMLEEGKKKKASTGSQLWMEKTILLNCNQKTIYEYLFQKLFLLTWQLKEQPLTYGTSLSISSQRKVFAFLEMEGSLLKPAVRGTDYPGVSALAFTHLPPTPPFLGNDLSSRESSKSNCNTSAGWGQETQLHWWLKIITEL